MKEHKTQEEPVIQQESPKQPDVPLGEAMTLAAEDVEQIRQSIAALQCEYEGAVSTAQRVQAEFDNYRKRNATLRQDSIDEGQRELMRDILPVLDNFDRALDNADGVDAGFVEGMQLVYRQLTDTLKKQGLEEIPSDGAFDPQLHDAVMLEEAPGVEANTILEVLQKGYRVKDRIIRHSMVKVAQ